MNDGPDREAIQAAGAAIDPNRLLPGEEPDTAFADDAQHWVAVYTKLLSTKARILNVTLEQMDGARLDEVQRELQTDRTVLLTEIERFQRRLRYWHNRELELSRMGDGSDLEA